MEFHAHYNHNDICIKQSAFTGKETVKINGAVVSTIHAAFRGNTWHKIRIQGPNGMEDGFVNIRTYLLDCRTVYRVVINGVLIDVNIYEIPVQMNFRELGFWLAGMAICCFGIVGVNRYFRLYGTPNIRLIGIAESVASLFLSTFAAKQLSSVTGERARQKMERDIADLTYRGK